MDPAEDMDELGADMGGLVLHPNGDLLTWVRECGDPQTMSARLAEEAAAMEDKRKCRRGLSLPPNLNFACCEGCVALELPGTLVNEKDCHDGNQSRGFCCCGSPGEGACLADSGALAEILEGRHAWSIQQYQIRGRLPKRSHIRVLCYGDWLEQEYPDEQGAGNQQEFAIPCCVLNRIRVTSSDPLEVFRGRILADNV